jgi:hypothetical protein
LEVPAALKSSALANRSIGRSLTQRTGMPHDGLALPSAGLMPVSVSRKRVARLSVQRLPSLLTLPA